MEFTINYEGESTTVIAEIIINSNVKNLNKTFDYIIPVEFEEKIAIGSRTLVPFGNKKELEEGFVVGIKETSEYMSKLKEIAKVEEKVYLSKDKRKKVESLWQLMC